MKEFGVDESICHTVKENDGIGVLLGEVEQDETSFEQNDRTLNMALKRHSEPLSQENDVKRFRGEHFYLQLIT